MPKPLIAAPPAAKEEEVQAEPKRASGVLALADAAQADIEKLKEIEDIETWICEDLDEMNIADMMDHAEKTFVFYDKTMAHWISTVPS